MAALSQEEMIVLNSLVYIDSDLWNKSRKLIDVVNELKENHSWTTDSGMSEEEYQRIFLAVEKNPALNQLEILYDEELDYKKYSAARILTFKSDNDPVVVFHGTSSDGKEDADNINGGFMADTPAQKGALQYINRLHDKYGYENISVTGHSKGGNKAMYVSVLSDYVTDCLAVDGQGFSNAFFAKYHRQIQDKKNRITVISADQSIVNHLFTQFAGTEKYISTDGMTAEETKLGPFRYHQPNVLIDIGDDGAIRLRAESDYGMWQKTINVITQTASTLFAAPQTCAAFLEGLAMNIAETATSSALGMEIEHLLVNLFPEMSDSIKKLFAPKGTLSDPVGSPFGEDVPLFAAALSENIVTGMAVSGLLAFGSTAELAVLCEAAVSLIVTVIVVYAIAKILEFVISNLINAGVEAAKAIGLAIEMAASWIAEKLADIGKAAIEGFHKAVDDAARLGQLAADAARAAKEAVSGAMKTFLANAGKFFESIGKGAKNWIDRIFGSTDAAIQHAERINVTMSRIEEMRKHVSSLQQSYIDVRGAADNASSVVSSVSGYYSESYVRNCCREIQNQLKKAQSYLNSAERELDRKRRVLAVAAESYRRADREAVDLVKNYI